MCYLSTVQDPEKVRLGFNPFRNKPWFLRVRSSSLFEDTAGIGEIARNEKLLLFPRSFLPFWIIFYNFSSSSKLSSANSFSLEESKICCLEKG